MKSATTAFFGGKVIITGEHSVVYGHPAVLASIDRGVTCHVTAGSLGKQWQQDAYVERILTLCANTLGLSKLLELGLDLSITSDLPQQSGLGSSAAFAAAVIEAVLRFYDHPFDPTQLYSLVHQAEQFVHRTSSGADPMIVVRGGSLLFQNGVGRNLDLGILADQTWYLINSGMAEESTGVMVAQVAKHPDRNALMQELGALSQEISVQLEAGNQIGQLINHNHMLLDRLGVVGQTARDIVATLHNNGIVAKITGAGGVRAGSGYILAWHEDENYMHSFLQQNNVDALPTQLGKRV